MRPVRRHWTRYVLDFLVITAVIGMVVLGFALLAGANTVLSWSGQCVVGCDGFAAFNINLGSSYVPDTLGGPSTDVLSAVYSDGTGSPGSDMGGSWRNLGVSVDMPGSLILSNRSFVTHPDGTWAYTSANHDASGIHGQWFDPSAPATVPELDTLWMGLTAIGALGLFGLWRKKPKPAPSEAEIDWLVRRAMIIEQQRGNEDMVAELRAIKDLNQAMGYLSRGETVPPALHARIQERRA